MPGRALLHFVGSVCFVLPDDGQRVSLGVEDPVLKWQVVVIGEQQVEVPGGRDTEEKSLTGDGRSLNVTLYDFMS